MQREASILGNVVEDHYESQREALIWRVKERVLRACENFWYAKKNPGALEGSI